MDLLIWDFSRTILFPKDKTYKGALNALYENMKGKQSKNLFIINKDLLSYIQSIRSKVHSIVFTTGYVQNDIWISSQIASVFVGIENVQSVGFSKNDPKSYIKICSKYNCRATESAFIDDEISNIQAAGKAGLKTIHYQDTNKTIEILNQWI